MERPFSKGPRLHLRVLGTTSELVVHGEVDLLSCPKLQAQIGRGFASSPQTLLIDMRDVGFIDSTVIAALLAASSRAESCDTHLRVLVAPGPVKRLFELCGVNSILTAPDEPEGTSMHLPPGQPTPIGPDRGISLTSSKER